MSVHKHNTFLIVYTEIYFELIYKLFIDKYLY